MSHRAGDPRIGYRRQVAQTDARGHFDYPASNRQRPFDQEESNRNVPNRNAKYHDIESEYRTRMTKDRHSSQDQEMAVGPNQGSTRFPFVSQSDMQKQCGEDPVYSLNSAKNMSIEDEDMFLYGSESNSSVYLRDYMHGQKEPQTKSADDGNPGITEDADVGKQDYDPTIENILKSIGFNIDLSQVVTEPTSKSETTVQRKRVSAMPASEPSVLVSEALVTSTARAGFSKKIDSILPAQETYEERARRYREEQTRLYAEANTSNDSVKALSQLTPPASGRSSLELLQSSYDYDAVVQEFAKEIESKEVQREMWAESEREHVSVETVVGPAATNKPERALYEDFSDSDDDLSDSGKPVQTKVKKVVDDFKAESQCSAIPDTSQFQDEIQSKRNKSKLGSRRETRANAAEPSLHSTNAERILSSEKTSKNVREHETTELFSRQVKVIPSTTVSEVGSGRNSSGSVRYVVGSKWDSPKRDERLDVETGSKNTIDQKITEKRQAKIQSLNIELDRLKQEQKGMMRRKQRGRYGHRDPELLENSRHQAKFDVEIDNLTKCTDEEFAELEDKLARKSPSTERKVTVTSRRKMDSSAATPEKSNTKSENKSDSDHKDRPKLSKMVVHYDYFDDGGHWCRSCNSIFATIDELCQHLHSSKHCEKMDSNHRPWAPKDTATKKGLKGVPVPIKGVEFLMPSQAFYCSLCSVFAGDAQCAHEHLKSNEHNENYQRFSENDTTYEHHYNLDKEAAMSLIGKRELENKRDIEGEKFGFSGKRSLSTKSSNQNTKRTKLSSEFSEKSPNEDYSNVQDAKSDTVPADSKMSNALSDGSQSDNRRCKPKDPASKAPSTLPPKTAVPQKKPAFIGKLPCLKGTKTLSSVSKFAKTNGTDVKEPKEGSGVKQVLSNVVESSKSQEIRTSEIVVKSSTLCSSDNLRTTKELCPVPLDALQERDESISSAVGQRLAAIKNSESGIEFKCHRDGSENQEETHTSESEKLDPSCVTEVMSLGDFEIFDECDAE